MHLKDDAHEFLQEATIRDLIKKYSQFVQFPIYLQTTKEVEVEADEDDADDDLDAKDDEAEVEDEDEDEDKEKEEKPKEMKKEIVKEWDLVNSQKAIWVRPKEEITEEEYTNFYQAISKSSDEPLAKTHFSAEGDIEFKSLLYVPKKAEADLMQKLSSAKSAIKMYVRRVLVGEQIDDLVPRYLSWVQGVVDSDDLPLNVSREQLQESKVLKTIGKKPHTQDPRDAPQGQWRVGSQGLKEKAMEVPKLSGKLDFLVEGAGNSLPIKSGKSAVGSRLLVSP